MLSGATPALVAIAVVLAGCAAPANSHDGHDDALDTGDIAPGATATLTYDALGTFAMHCHPHPWMKHNVTVTADAPGAVHVHIHDGGAPGDYRFEPTNITIGKGSVVTYHNHGNMTHTATEA